VIKVCSFVSILYMLLHCYTRYELCVSSLFNHTSDTDICYQIVQCDHGFVLEDLYIHFLFK